MGERKERETHTHLCPCKVAAVNDRWSSMLSRPLGAKCCKVRIFPVTSLDRRSVTTNILKKGNTINKHEAKGQATSIFILTFHKHLIVEFV
jgi:hypothetical protein